MPFTFVLSVVDQLIEDAVLNFKLHILLHMLSSHSQRAETILGMHGTNGPLSPSDNAYGEN